VNTMFIEINPPLTESRQFTGTDFTGGLERCGITISMGWRRPLHGQRLHRAVMAQPEV
jgi:hypothetical protein